MNARFHGQKLVLIFQNFLSGIFIIAANNIISMRVKNIY